MKLQFHSFLCISAFCSASYCFATTTPHQPIATEGESQSSLGSRKPILEYSLTGIFRMGDETYFCIRNNRSQHSRWVRERGVALGLFLENFLEFENVLLCNTGSISGYLKLSNSTGTPITVTQDRRVFNRTAGAPVLDVPSEQQVAQYGRNTSGNNAIGYQQNGSRSSNDLHSLNGASSLNALNTGQTLTEKGLNEGETDTTSATDGKSLRKYKLRAPMRRQIVEQ